VKVRPPLMINVGGKRMSQEPLKLIGLLSRRPDLTLAQFSHHWRTRHRNLSLRLIAPGIMSGYIQNHRRPDADPIPGLPLAGDGFPELWTEGEDVLARLGASSEYLEGAYLDEPNFMDGRSQALLAREIVIDDGPGRVAAPTLVKAMLFFKRAVDVPFENFARAWERTLHPILMPAAKPIRLTRQLAIKLPGDPGATYQGVQTYAGQEASYWPDIPSFLATWKNREAVPEYIDKDVTVGVIVREEPVLFPIHHD
jgi:EthD domain